MKESELQAMVIAYCHSKKLVPRAGMEGAKRTIWQATQAKRMGLVKGWPDIMVFDRRVNYSGLAIELKIKPNKLTKEQREVMVMLSQNGWVVAVSYTFEEAKNLIDGWLSLPKIPLRDLGVHTENISAKLLEVEK